MQIEAAIDGFIDMIVGLDATLTSEQRGRVISRLRSFADALEPALSPTDRLVVSERIDVHSGPDGAAPITCLG